MATSTKITFLGGGALRLLGTIDALLRKKETFSTPRLVFMDLDIPRAETMAALATMMPSARSILVRARHT